MLLEKIRGLLNIISPNTYGMISFYNLGMFGENLVNFKNEKNQNKVFINDNYIGLANKRLLENKLCLIIVVESLWLNDIINAATKIKEIYGIPSPKLKTLERFSNKELLNKPITKLEKEEFIETIFNVIDSF